VRVLRRGHSTADRGLSLSRKSENSMSKGDGDYCAGPTVECIREPINDSFAHANRRISYCPGFNWCWVLFLPAAVSLFSPRNFSILKLCLFCKICDITYCQCYLPYCEKDHESFYPANATVNLPPQIAKLTTVVRRRQVEPLLSNKLQQGICCEQKKNTTELCFSNNLQQ
jgi:hypothetical protein